MTDTDANKAADPVFKPLSGEDCVSEVTEVESYCVNCGENGTTKLLLTVIPFYKEVILSSFRCSHCEFENNEIQSAGEIALRGIRYILKSSTVEDLSRTVVKSDYAFVKIPELDLEIPEKSQKGEITTVEGILERVIRGLEQDQERRREEHPEEFQKIATFIAKIRQCLLGDTPFTLIINDISGNSFISTPSDVLPGHKDDALTVTKFDRTKEENHILGLYEDLSAVTEEEEEEKVEENRRLDLTQEVMELPTICYNCLAPCTTKMKLTRIPHFKEVVIMATNCDKCGYRTNEVKSGAGIEKKGRRIELRVSKIEDLSRDLLKSDTCDIEIPDLELEVGAGTLGGKFTTVEGLVTDIKNQLTSENPLVSGDSAKPEMKLKMGEFTDKLEKILACETPWVLILDDPAGNSYLQNICSPDDDPDMKITDYERTFEQNDELGLNDMNVGDSTEEPATAEASEIKQLRF